MVGDQVEWVPAGTTLKMCIRDRYYEVRVQGVSTFIANPHYDYVPQLQRRLARQYRDLGLVKGVTLYEAFINSPELFRYLTDPSLCPS